MMSSIKVIQLEKMLWLPDDMQVNLVNEKLDVLQGQGGSVAVDCLAFKGEVDSDRRRVVHIGIDTIDWNVPLVLGSRRPTYILKLASADLSSDEPDPRYFSENKERRNPVEILRAEFAVYEKLKAIQGTVVPKVYGFFSSSPNDHPHIRVAAILMDYCGELIRPGYLCSEEREIKYVLQRSHVGRTMLLRLRFSILSEQGPSGNSDASISKGLILDLLTTPVVANCFLCQKPRNTM